MAEEIFKKEASRYLHEKTNKLFFDLFFKGTRTPNSKNRLGFYRVLTTDKKFEDLVRDSAARTLGPPDGRVMIAFKSYFDSELDLYENYNYRNDYLNENEGLIQFLVLHLELNPEETERLWEIIYYNLRVVEENKRKMDEEDRKRFARFDDTPVVPLSRKQPQTPKEDEMPDYVAPKTKARDRTNPPPFPPPAPGDAPAPGRLPWIPGVGNAQAQRAYNNFPWDESGGRRRKLRKSRKSRKSSNKKMKQRKTKRRRQ